MDESKKAAPDAQAFPVDATSQLAEVRGLLARNDPIACHWWVEWAGKQPAEVVLPGLCAILEQPRGFLQRLRWQRHFWGQVRADAVRTLESFESAESLPTILQTLIHDPHPGVRNNAAQALYRFGSSAVTEMLEGLRHTENWPLEGMKMLLRTLGDLKDRRAGPSLAKILFGDLPLSPSRWMRRPILWTSCAASLASLLAMICMASLVEAPLATILFGGLVTFLPFFVLIYLFLALPMGLVQQGMERNELHQAASDALIALQYKMGLPSMIEMAFGSRPGSVRAQAKRVLRTLLPLLGPEDTGLLNASQERHLLEALGAVDEEMAMTILRALEFVGTGQAAGPVERFLRRYHSPVILPRDTPLRDEAERILPLLQARLQQEQSAAHLLRASHLPQNAPEEMLRPVLQPANTPPEQLLRPTTDKE